MKLFILHLKHFVKGYVEEKSAAPLQCKFTCNATNTNTGNTGGLQIVFNETTSLVGVVNVTAKAAFVLDIKANLVAVFNGSSGAVIVVNFQTGSGVYIAAGQSSSLWLSAHESFEVYFNTLTSLQVIIDLKVGISFDKSSVSSAILEALGNLLIHLVSQLKLEIQGNINALTILLKISSSLSVLLNGTLQGILKLLGKGLISIHGDLVWLVSVFEGLALFLAHVNGGLAALIKAGVEIDLPLLLRATNGIEFLVNLLLAIVARIDLSILSGLLNSVEKLLSVIVKLGGNVSVGVTGLIKVVAEIVALIHDHLELDVLIHSLLEFLVSKSTNVDISIYIEGLLKVIEIQAKNYSSSSLSAFISFVQNLHNGKLVIAGIDISEIINLLIKGAVNGIIELVVVILLRLSVVVEAVVAIPSLLLHLLQLVNSTAGIHLLQQAIPDISIDINISIHGNIVQQIFKGVNIKTIISLIAKGFNIEAVLKALPVLGQIYSAVYSAVHAASGGSLSLAKIFKENGAASIIIKIQAWIRSALHISGGITLPTLRPGGGISGSAGSVSTQSSSGSWQWSIGVHGK
ncbi:hypothetical protein NQ314_005002 [Rhamnusium bicolor]|uniref:Uncharacterized protein n=1 Tax=Rhamnusium bicolor TaxID=1586634 RepID=A0AAV8ZJ74_9CUCU|nr:hypothetical protein NQ314_005002 [Rhamnusium bicolor]